MAQTRRPSQPLLQIEWDVMLELGQYGVWRGWRLVDIPFAVEVERLGFGTLWVGGSPSGELRQVDELLAATESLVIASSIVNMWKDSAETVAASFGRIEATHPGRFMLGVGIGHPEDVTEYRQPYATIVAYLDHLAARGVPPERTLLAALGPRVLRLAAHRTAGAHPYLTTPDHTRVARSALGPTALLVPEQMVVLGHGPAPTAGTRAIARPPVSDDYLTVVNYRRNMERLGWAESDLDDGGSDALIDALVMQGDGPAIASGVAAHLTAGADHVAIQVLGDDPRPGLRTVAGALRLGR